ncbi:MULTISPECIES: putative quinol monooxygenase [unclassified Shewanella]|uniref:putative quinol monooxygenase n=1 Tax=unclassified Shewanella TaxID=196818 RepID=UPI0005A1411A|nr:MULTISPECIES: antibiotic biosynthesis monooxygenase family protein [unclassified Shewanella]KIO37082.1 antibiotic biosynthesis monooxygenase [Shewanella sp. cp20]MCG9748597.1 antibiotic biosynthesis monooxygenase [Shewanella sp. Isolate8]
MIVRIGEFQAAPGQAEALKSFLLSLSEYICASPGCLSYEVLCPLDEAGRLLVIERWESAEHHRASVQAYPKDKMQDAMLLFAAPPTGGYYALA